VPEAPRRHVRPSLSAPDRFRWLSGEEHVVTYCSSGRAAPVLPGRGSVVPVVLPHLATAFVPAGNLEGDPGRRPELHMFAASRAPWFPITDSLPQYAAFPPEFGDGESVENPPPELKPGLTLGAVSAATSPGN
jgi:hypothetical protein